MLKVKNLSRILALLKNENASGEDLITKPLLVTGVGDDYIQVASSQDADLTIRLRGITGVAIGSMVTVDTTTSIVTVVSTPQAESSKAAAEKKPGKVGATKQGCRDRSSIVQ